MNLQAIGWTAVAWLLAAGAAAAQDAPAKGKGHRDGGVGPLRLLDSDRDGKISKGEFEAGFTRLDKDGDGFLTKEELSSVGPGPRRQKSGPERGTGRGFDLFSRLDADKDGKISKTEYEAAFALLDKNADGTLSKEDLKAVRDSGDKGAKRGKAGRKGLRRK